MNAADLHIGRVVLRGTAADVEHARRQLPATLARAPWPADEAIVVVRRVAVGGTTTELPARAAATAEHLVRRAADPWSPAADAAEAVRFRDALDYRACLVRDLLAGTATHRWLWRHRTALLARPAAEALAELLVEDALALPALLERPALHDSLPALWRTLDAPAAREVLRSIGSATGWQGAISAALAPTTNERRAEKRSAFRRMSQRESTTAAAHLAPSDPRVLLQAVLALWTQAPTTLTGSNAGEALRATAETLAHPTPDPINPATQYRMAAGQGNSSLPFKGAETGFRRAPLCAAAAAELSADSRAGVGMGQADVAETHPPPDQESRLRLAAPQAASGARRNPCSAPLEGGGTPPPSSSRVSSTAASPAVLPPAADVDFRTRGGGFFFLLNVLNLPALHDWRATLAEPRAGWRELVRLARRLDFIPDAPLAAFLADACALEPGGDPAAALATLPPGADPAPVHHAAQRHYGDAPLAAALAERPARIRATASHLDVDLRLGDVHLDIRRTGLDLDPGWLPWLGRVVHFHYD